MATAQTSTNVNWTGGPGNWTNTSKWFNETSLSTGFLPSVDYNEIARIDGGVVTVNTGLANGTDASGSTNPGGVRLGTVSGAGELTIANAGTLRVQDGTATNGSLVVGGAGSGTLRVQRGGSLTVDGPLTSAAASTNLIALGSAAGVGTANLTVGSASFGGTTIVHRDVAFASSSITLQSSGVYQPVFTGGVSSVLQATGSANLGGTLRPDFGGSAPAVGSSWNLFEAAGVNGVFANIDSSLAGALGEGVSFIVSTPAISGGRRAVQLSLKQLPVLNVNRDTGAVSLTNPGTTAVTLDGYSISSTLGAINAGQWSSFQDQNVLGGGWRESPPTANRLSELKQSGVGSLAGGQTISLGAVFSPTPTTLGAPTEDFQFQYTSPEGILSGLVKYTGTKVNNILLQVDPTNGEARLRNPSSFSVNIDGYTITSAGSLTPAGWTSLDDQNTAGGDWRESPGLSTRLSELKQTASTTLAPGASYNLGAIFNPTMPKDLTFEFLQLGQSQATAGAVVFAPLTAAVTPGDFDQNGVVNGQDLNLWKTAFGTTTQANADGDSDSDGNDFLIWQRNLGASGATPAATVTAAAVPEPTSLVVAIGLTAALGAYRRGFNRVSVLSVP
ncbi:MAG: hypothetical protein H0T51_20180 [Pirellulales bacterium]|nr:hypothetical protein [Pirellulales bacterium]